MERPSCNTFNYIGIGLFAVGSVITGVRQTSTYRNDFSTTGTAFGFIGGIAMLGGIGLFTAGQQRSGCRGPE